MPQEFKIVGKLSDVELANALLSTKITAVQQNKESATKIDIKDRNILMNELLKIEKERFQAQQAMVNEWAKLHPRFATDLELIRQTVNELHTYVRTQLQNLPIDKESQAELTISLEKKIDEYNDTVEDKMFDLETKEIAEGIYEAEERRKKRNANRDATAAKRLEDIRKRRENEENARIAEEIEKEREAKRLKEEEERKAAEARQAEESKRKSEALDTHISDNEMILNIAGINADLISFSPKIAEIIRSKKMTSATMAKTKTGALVVVCKKPDSETKENVRITWRDGKYNCSIASNSFCKHIRNQFTCNLTDEYRFLVKCVAYADDIKIRIDNLIN